MKRSPHTAGVYALLIRVPRRETIRVGRLGPVELARGVYIYVGSALNSLEGRIARHLRRKKRTHWHIDYLLRTTGVKVAGVAIRHATRRLECEMSRKVQKGAFSCIHGFGCSDCKCNSHLHYLRDFQAASKVLIGAGFVLADANDYYST